MKAAKDLIDDFRSYKDFYPWDKYIKYLGYGGNVLGSAATPARNTKLAAMAERLRQNLAPAEGEEQAPKIPTKILPPDHRGISFDKWLEIFLEYAFTLVREGKRREAYIVCHAARDSIIWSGIENSFLIHIAWASCAVYAGDEETCVAIARYFMRDYLPGTDSYRMFAAMCRVCQTPVSWYTSGPAQKFILRQIKTMDNIQLKSASKGPAVPNFGLDICLLTIYGHILFSTTSYTYALSYFSRAASLDPHNCLINLSTGLAYLHYALKRQATNRQYLLAQGFAFLFRYYHDRLRDAKSAAERQEAHFNIARAYSLIGLGNLANVYYKKVLEEGEKNREELVSGSVGSEDLTMEAAYNVRTVCYLLGDVEGAKAVTERWLRLR
jgi:general transcription factor 3C polypeptide 3 (transcription factor C subunit 4)